MKSKTSFLDTKVEVKNNKHYIIIYKKRRLCKTFSMPIQSVLNQEKKDPIHPIKLFIKWICSTTEDFMHYSRKLKKTPIYPARILCQIVWSTLKKMKKNKQARAKRNSERKAQNKQTNKKQKETPLVLTSNRFLLNNSKIIHQQWNIYCILTKISERNSNNNR